jgi:hypothetical protein
LEIIKIDGSGGGKLLLSSTPAFGRTRSTGALGDRANQLPRGKRKDLPPIAIENSGKSRLTAELPHLHPQASLLYISHQPPWRAGSGRQRWGFD